MRATDERDGGAGDASGERTVWWHQVDDDEGEEAEGDGPEDDDGNAHDPARDASSWVAARDLTRARMQLMRGRAPEAIAALEKLRRDFVAFARDVCY